MLAERPALYVTLLRDPVRHFLSYLTYVKKVYRGIHDVALLRYLPPETPDMSLRDIAEWILTQAEDIPFKENYTVNFFAEYVWSQISGYARPSCEYGITRWDAFQFKRYQAVRQDLARVILGNFAFVGIVEHMDICVRLFRERCAGLGWKLTDAPPGHENISSELLDDLAWLHPGDRVGSLLFDSLREDLDLYRIVKARCREAAFGTLEPAIKYDRQLVAVGAGAPPPVCYFVENGMRRMVAGPLPSGSALPAVTSITQWELDDIPPGAPLETGFVPAAGEPLKSVLASTPQATGGQRVQKVRLRVNIKNQIGKSSSQNYFLVAGLRG